MYCLHLFRTKIKLKSHEKLSKNKDFCGVLLPDENKILKFVQYLKSFKAESLIEEIDGYKSNLEKSSTSNIDEHITCGYSQLHLPEFQI